MSRWTATRLARHTTALLRDARLILVSNRAPYSHRWHSTAPLARGADAPLGTTVWDCGWLRRLPAQVCRLFQGAHALRWSQPAGGLTAALDPVMQACHGTWVAWGSGSADRQAVDAQDHVQVPPHKPQYTLRRVWLSETQVDGFYSGFANSALWPLCHLNLERTVFTPLHWRHYQEVNAHFATIAAEECGDKRALVWLQDYHLALCPALLRQRLPDLAIMHFWHVPWPPWELYRACPWRRELLEGLLGNDLLGSTSRSTVTISSSVRSECWAPASTTKPVLWRMRGATRGYDHSPLALTMLGGRIWPVDVAWRARLCACARSLTWRFLFSAWAWIGLIIPKA